MNWTKQLDEPLFPDILWSRPERKSLAGKLLIIGGNSHEFAHVQQAYQLALEAGVGECKVVMPEKLRRLIGHLEDCEFVPANSIGSFAQSALAPLLEYAAWADAVLLPGDISRNSETTIMLQQFAREYNGLLIATRDAFDQLVTDKAILDRPQTLLVASLSQVQQLAKALKHPTAIRFEMNNDQLVQALYAFTSGYASHWIVQHENWIHLLVDEEVVSTRLPQAPIGWQLETVTLASMLWTQNQAKPLEALSTAIFQIKQSLS